MVPHSRMAPAGASRSILSSPPPCSHGRNVNRPETIDLASLGAIPKDYFPTNAAACSGFSAPTRRECRDVKSKRKRHPRSVLRLPDLEQSKSAVLNSRTSPSSQRSYDHAIREFIDWYCSEPRLAFNKTVVTRYRIFLEQAQFASSTINLRLNATSGLSRALNEGANWPTRRSQTPARFAWTTFWPYDWTASAAMAEIRLQLESRIRPGATPVRRHN